MARKDIIIAVNNVGSIYYTELGSFEFKSLDRSLEDLRELIEMSDVIYCENIAASIFSGERLLVEILKMIPEKEVIDKFIVLGSDTIFSVVSHSEIVEVEKYFKSGGSKLGLGRDYTTIDTAFTRVELLISELKLISLIDYIKISEITNTGLYQSFSVPKARQIKKRYDYFETTDGRENSFTTKIAQNGAFTAIREGEISTSTPTEMYILSLWGYANRERYNFGKIETLEDILKKEGYGEVADPYSFIMRHKDGGAALRYLEGLWLNSIRKYNVRRGEEVSRDQYYYSKLTYNLIKAIKELRSVMIFEITQDRISLGILGNTNIEKLLNIIYEATNRYCEGLYVNITIDSMNVGPSDVTSSFDMKALNVLPIKWLESLEKIDIQEVLEKSEGSMRKRLGICLVLDKIKEEYIPNKNMIIQGRKRIMAR